MLQNSKTATHFWFLLEQVIYVPQLIQSFVILGNITYTYYRSDSLANVNKFYIMYLEFKISAQQR